VFRLQVFFQAAFTSCPVSVMQLHITRYISFSHVCCRVDSERFSSVHITSCRYNKLAKNRSIVDVSVGLQNPLLLTYSNTSTSDLALFKLSTYYIMRSVGCRSMMHFSPCHFHLIYVIAEYIFFIIMTIAPDIYPVTSTLTFGT